LLRGLTTFGDVGWPITGRLENAEAAVSDVTFEKSAAFERRAPAL
jgi:hypothetical protein